MKKTENCRELFLRGLTDAYLYSVRDSTLPIPCSIAGILQMNGCRFAGEALHIATIEGDNYVTADSITARESARNYRKNAWQGLLYSLAQAG